MCGPNMRYIGLNYIEKSLNKKKFNWTLKIENQFGIVGINFRLEEILKLIQMAFDK